MNFHFSLDNSMASPIWLAYLRLFRIGNVFTAIADIAMGFVFVTVTQASPSWSAFSLAVGVSCLLYSAGMILNDAFDAPIDAVERPERPIPSRQVSRNTAFLVGFAMLMFGFVLSLFIGRAVGGETFTMRPAWIALCLVGSILAYDGLLKKTPLGPISMGLCRFFNVLLGMSAAMPVAGETPRLWGFGGPELMAAGGIGLYIVGVTWFARTEARVSNRVGLSLALITMILGLSLLAAFPYVTTLDGRFATSLRAYGPLLFALVGVVVVRRCIDAIIRPEPQQVQRAIKQSILSLILFNASVCLAVAPDRPYYGMLVLALLGPTLFLGRWIAAT